MSSGPPPPRSSQLSHQKEWLAAKKAEILQKQKEKQALLESGCQTQAARLAAAQQASAAAAKTKNSGLRAKNRWGFKGKAPAGAKPGIKTEEAAISNVGKSLDEYGSSSSATVKQETIKTEPLGIVRLPSVVEELATLVAVNGDAAEKLVRDRNKEQSVMQFLQNESGELYKQYRKKVEEVRATLKQEKKEARKRSRWDMPGNQDPQAAGPSSAPTAGPSQTNAQAAVAAAAIAAAKAAAALAAAKATGAVAPPASKSDGKLTSVTRSDPKLVAYAMKVYGTVQLDEDQWKQCEDQIKLTMVYDDIVAKKRQQDMLAQKGKRQYEYDSDEETEDGTWEHKARKVEMEKTADKARELTDQAKGKHHIGDFLPPDELDKFIKKYDAVKRGESYVESDYHENQLTESNMGFKMLQKMGWTEGAGLGAEEQGITQPINKSTNASEKSGLGTTKPHDLEQSDSEFDAYRKRMMLAYRFRPNPLNNPRRAYY